MMEAILNMTSTSRALERVAGMTLLRRAQLTMRHFGAERVLVLIDAGADRDALAARFAGEVDAFITVAEWRDELDSMPAQRWLLASADHVHDKGWKGAVEAAKKRSDHGVVRDGEVVSALRLDTAHTLSQRLEEGEGAIASLFVSSDAGKACDVDASSEEGMARATEALWNSCRKEIDGVISRHLNRHLSLFISRRIVNLPIKPNHVTIFCIFLGLASGYFALSGDYWGILIGAILLKANSVIDGVDGELARVKWEFSKSGELLDSVGDNVANFSFFGALTYATYQSGDTFFGTLGVACIAMWASYVAFLYAQLFKMKRGDVLIVRQNVDEVARGWFKQLIHLLRTVILRRDGYVFMILMLAIVGAHQALITMMCAGAAIPFFGMLLHYGMEFTRDRSPERA